MTDAFVSFLKTRERRVIFEMLRGKLFLLPIMFVVLLPLTFIITYSVAVSDGGVYPFFPFISDTGTLPPESCVFGQLLNIAAVLILTIVYLRYRQVETYWSVTHSLTPYPRANTAFLVLGLLSGVGLSIVGNFQVENSKGFHIFGALLAFIVGGAYFCTQTFISWKVPDIPGSTKTTRVIRLLICILYCCFAVIGIVTFLVSKSKLRPEKISTRLWTASYKGYAEHVTSAVMEWLGSFLICAYAATFTPEFKHLKLTSTLQIGSTPSELLPSGFHQYSKMFRDNLHIFPIFIVIYVPVSFFITYGIAVGNGHVNPGFPYISDTGTLPPESCVFGQLLNIGAVIALAVFYIRYKQIETFQSDCPVLPITRVNKTAFVLGLTTAFGISLVGNFQETNVVVVHVIGAFLAFVVGGVYCCLQTYLSFKLPQIPGSSKNLRIARLIICILDFIFMVVLLVASFVNSSPHITPPAHWTSDKPGYGAHLTSTIAEWIIAFLTCIYVATFTTEFKYFEMIKPKITFRNIPEYNVSTIESTANSTAIENGATNAKY
ncbi:uncharacterized protein LOC125645592 [Ostrea edulis]|uniref:uncharacterized protein LOC125645592 n=1 Tax=Ostrea edulis TaxID=37623 RepID=UPI0024AEF53E|nr:uncharacterized protein LOC125645592 [Ostrea edulis]